MKQEISDLFPLSKKKFIQGTRRLAREKVLQILTASNISEVSPDEIFNHIFYRKFNVGDDFSIKSEKLLTPDEIAELEADIPIKWSKDDIEFSIRLIKFAYEKRAVYDEMIEQYTKNWELDRIALIDRILMNIALAELLMFPEIPVKVSVNEALELSKKYSTERSSIFINGILDSILIKLKNEDSIHKEGKGLKNS